MEPFRYADQVHAIATIGLSLPLGYDLYVKEHTGLMGNRPLADLRRIRRIPRVRLIGPLQDTFELIQQPAGLVILSGTMGCEGVLYGKRVVAPGIHLAPRLPRSLAV